MSKQIPVLFSVCILSASLWVTAIGGEVGEWRTGRATYYGERHDGSTDGYSILKGSCMFGRIDPNNGTGWDIAALPDVHPDFANSCGKCYEVACEPMVFTDNYGEKLDRSQSCIAPNKTVIVTVVDTCPCHYPPNQWSNKRWCCGDMDHFDLSIYAFEKIGMVEKGVIGLKYRSVPCPGGAVDPTASPQSHSNSSAPEQEESEDQVVESLNLEGPESEKMGGNGTENGGSKIRMPPLVMFVVGFAISVCIVAQILFC